ncbi:CoxG family protein [Streptomyces sp. NPDC050560]|uniref:CoxG family protein n=1 Tax=Streptomyces sp. NPDC050560 TaxID=3365630 RepID=UPI0037B0E967
MAEFEFDETVSLAAAPEVAWDLMTDVPRLTRWISVVHDARELEPLRHYTAVIQDKVGMFKLRAELDITLTGVDEGKRVVAHAEGQDRQVGSRITVDAEVLLEAAEDGTATDVRVHGRYAITGNAATLGSSAIRRKGDKVVKEFFQHLGSETRAA